MKSAAKHIPVLFSETMAALAVKEGGRYIDGTLGRAGHTRGIIERGGMVLGIDRDDQALEEVGAMDFGGRLLSVKGVHGDLEKIAAANGWEKVDGILLDLGVSSPQLDEAGRGFSFMRSGPLDMRMDRTRILSAAEIVNAYPVEKLVRILREYGEEREALRLAKAIVRRRGTKNFTDTMELATFIEQTVGRHGAHHPATRTFQALRMEVNDEMGELERALEGGMRILKKGGRFCVITFESLTDRVVKQFFAAHVGKMESLQQGGEKWTGESPRAVKVTKKPIAATEEELKKNPRSRSALLRVIEKGEM